MISNYIRRTLGQRPTPTPVEQEPLKAEEVEDDFLLVKQEDPHKDIEAKKQVAGGFVLVGKKEENPWQPAKLHGGAPWLREVSAKYEFSAPYRTEITAINNLRSRAIYTANENLRDGSAMEAEREALRTLTVAAGHANALRDELRAKTSVDTRTVAKQVELDLKTAWEFSLEGAMTERFICPRRLGGESTASRRLICEVVRNEDRFEPKVTLQLL